MRTRSASADAPAPAAGRADFASDPSRSRRSVGHSFSRRSESDACRRAPRRGTGSRSSPATSSPFSGPGRRALPPKRLPKRSPRSPPSKWNPSKGSRRPPKPPPGAPPKPPAAVGSKPSRTAGVPEPVVGPPLLGVLQDVVGLLDLLEPLLGGLVARVDVGMELAGEAPVGLLDVGLRGPLRDAQNLVVVAFFHALSAIIAAPKLSH